jgi:hypothetical protein
LDAAIERNATLACTLLADHYTTTLEGLRDVIEQSEK